MLIFGNCSSDNPNANTETVIIVAEIKHSSSTDTIETEKISVIIVPCYNGYQYGLKMGDLNPSLEKHLASHSSIILESFPLSKMEGSGYQGVFDKKHCNKILENVNVDFLIMTKMVSNYFVILTQAQSVENSWGYETKILNTKTLEQFDGISASNLHSFESIDGNIKEQIEVLVTKMK